MERYTFKQDPFSGCSCDIEEDKNGEFLKKMLNLEMRRGNKMLRCSFCDKTEDEVSKLVSRSDKVQICDKCILVCVGSLFDELKHKPFVNVEIDWS